MRPRFIRSRPDLDQVVEIGTTIESLCLEFKSAVEGWRIPDCTPKRDQLGRKGQKELCRDISQFANTIGGCLVIGVEEAPVGGASFARASGFAPIGDPLGLRQWIEQAIKNYLVPSIFRHDIHPIQVSGGALLSINVPPSRSLVALWDDEEHTLQFAYRTSHGKDYMNPDDVERRWSESSRAGKISYDMAGEKATVKGEVDVANGFWNFEMSRGYMSMPVACASQRQTEEEWVSFDVLRGPEACPIPFVVPYSLIREAWVGPGGRVTILLGARPVWDNPQPGQFRFTLQPY